VSSAGYYPTEAVTVGITLPTPFLGLLRTVRDDTLYRGSLFLLANTVATSALGFVFWTLTAHRYSATTVGVFSSVTSGVTLLAAIAALGLPITMTRHIAVAENPRGLVLVAVTMITTAGTALCLATILFLGPHLPSAFHIQQHGGIIFLVTVLVVFTAIGGTLDAGLVATRSTRFLLVKNLIASVFKVAAMLFLTALRSSGLLLSLGLALVLAAALSMIALSRRLNGNQLRLSQLQLPWHYLSITSGNYLATVIGILPLSVVPIEVLAERGAAQTARFAIAFLIAGFLNFIPSTMGQVLFAETARGGVPLGRQFRKALRTVYGILLPCLALLLATAPFVLRFFGPAYVADSTGCLRVLALSSIPAGGTYLIDSLLTARDRTAAYTFMQIANAALVLGFVGALLPRGLTAAASGLALAQVVTLLLGLLVLATGRLGRHHSRAAAESPRKGPNDPLHDTEPPALDHAVEPEVRDLLAAWTIMPTTLTGEYIGWDRSSQILPYRAEELRSAVARTQQDVRRTSYPMGEIAQCSIWFPPIELPVGFGQTRAGKQLPVLAMITGYSRWLSATLIPSTRAEDLFAGWWKLIADLGAVPRKLTTHSDRSIGWWMRGQNQLTTECSRFGSSLGTTIVIGRAGDPMTTSLIEQAKADLEKSFLRGRTFKSPKDLNSQLLESLRIHNTRPRQTPTYPPAALITADKKAMMPLPPIPPATGWRLSMRVGIYPFVEFDNNRYSVHPAAIGRKVELIADLSHVRVLCDGKEAARHNRAWTHKRIIRDPAHEIALR
jgi:O-antigen/teichoic acid export membrane protein